MQSSIFEEKIITSFIFPLFNSYNGFRFFVDIKKGIIYDIEKMIIDIIFIICLHILH